MSTARAVVSPQARLTYLAISAILCGGRRGFPARARLSRPLSRALSTTGGRASGTYFRSDFANQGFTSEYIPNENTTGPLKDASPTGAPRITPRLLKDHLDAFVVGQERAKKALATAVYNHYQRIQELQRREEEEEERHAQEERRRMAELRRHPIEDEFPGQQPTVNMPPPGQTMEYRPLRLQARSRQQQQQQQQQQQPHGGFGPQPLVDNSPMTIEKSNILLLGPSGVGKTLMAKTLARVLEVPFSMSDCTPFTQAGYIGEDADVCVQRLLAAANYDVAKAERGIICLDEIDKIATAKVSHGKDVSGEGVQQALLKIIEGTTLQIQAKQERSSSGTSNTAGAGGRHQGFPTSGPLSGGGGGGQQNPTSSGGQKGEIYNVRTDHILFICAGAFNGLHKMILDRISKGSIGFGAAVRAAPSSSNSNDSNLHETILEGEDALFEKHLPYYMPPQESKQPLGGQPSKRKFNTLDLVEPQDLQRYGLIPELVGRIPLTCALSSLDVPALVQVLTEPRNSLLQQYKQLFALSSIDLRITSPALHLIAANAAKMGTGARGLRTVMERVLADAMFETPGSGVKYVLVDEEVADRRGPAKYFYRGEMGAFQRRYVEEEEAWEERKGEGETSGGRRRGAAAAGTTTFEEYRQKISAGGFV
ncbi:hypothetical protein M433DRAFT_75279 [Acidomyces richmondensis BFW]|nr:MAG: hypothetical protein FE78DRAFT_139965 [Acidomyces sp. 'richmondensis']KYG41722.1 hypothetical protein M433DRAFT_75279 [Acidomyces richmondensis BFW]